MESYKPIESTAMIKMKLLTCSQKQKEITLNIAKNLSTSIDQGHLLAKAGLGCLPTSTTRYKDLMQFRHKI
jgi:hypothetical protein